MTRLWAWGRVTQPRKKTLADLCTFSGLIRIICPRIHVPEMPSDNVLHTEDFYASDLKHHLRRVDLAHVAPLILLSHAQDAQRPSSGGVSIFE